MPGSYFSSMEVAEKHEQSSWATFPVKVVQMLLLPASVLVWCCRIVDPAYNHLDSLWLLVHVVARHPQSSWLLLYTVTKQQARRNAHRGQQCLQGRVLWLAQLAAE